MIEVIREENPAKERKVTIHTAMVYHDIDELTYKLSEVSIQDMVVGDRVASDVENANDSHILARYLATREATLRNRLIFCLKDEEVESIDNSLSSAKDIVFEFILPVSFKDARLRQIVTFIHDYLVKGTLLDWYNHMGTNFGANLIEEVDSLEGSIINLLRGDNYIRYPSVPYVSSYRTR